MPARHCTPLLALVILGCVLVAAPAHAGPDQKPPPAWGPGFGASLIRSDAEVAANPQSWRGGTVVLQSWQTDELARLKSRNPDLVVLMYKNMSATYRDTCTDGCTRDSAVVPGGVGYHWAQDHHPDWFLRDERGREVEWADWRGLFPMDTASADYQDAWTTNVLAELAAHDWDGVMVDDALTWLSHPTVGDRVGKQVPTDAAQYAATRSFLTSVGPRLRDAGHLVVPNITLAWDGWRRALVELSPYVSGWENEHFVLWGRDGGARFTDGDDWAWKLAMAQWLADRDLPLLAVSYSTPEDRAAMRYHRATWLLAWNGRTGASMFVTTDHLDPQDQRAATTDVGLPLGPPERLADGTWRRTYDAGLVLVNPTGSARVVDVPPGYSRQGSLTLQAASGRVLRRID